MGKALGIVSLVCGIIAVIVIILVDIVFPLLSVPGSPVFIGQIGISIVAIVCGGIGIKKDDSPGFAIAGLVLGSIGVIICIFVMIWTFIDFF